MRQHMNLLFICMILSAFSLVPAAASASTEAGSNLIKIKSESTGKNPVPESTEVADRRKKINKRKRWKKRRHYKRHHARKRSRIYHRRYHHRYRDDSFGPGDVFGIIGGILINEAFRQERRRDFERCDRRYKTFRWRDGTYQPYGDVPRRLCPYLR